jgi:hypothetical protein
VALIIKYTGEYRALALVHRSVSTLSQGISLIATQTILGPWDLEGHTHR